MVRQRAALLLPFALVACTTGSIGGDSTSATSTLPSCPAEAEPPAFHDTLEPTRVLRRIAITLTGVPPSSDEYAALAGATTNEAREAILSAAIDKALASPAFYEKVVELGHDWLKTGSYTTGAMGESYWGNMSGDLGTCGGSTKHAGAFYALNELGENGAVTNVCNDLDLAGKPLEMAVNNVEPWWAPGTKVTIIGRAGGDVRTLTDDKGAKVDCGVPRGGYWDMHLAVGCGCGPNLVWCFPLPGLASGDPRSESMQRRAPWEEPARFLGHLAWHDRPLSDLVVGNYSVGNNMLRALYVRMARKIAFAHPELDDDTSWWRPGGEPRDPLHADKGDPSAWREFEVSKLDPYLLSSRTVSYDPRKTTEAAPGVPAAGVLTMMGSLSTFSRERPRAARFLEIFACQNFVPPPASEPFNAYDGDPATSGSCQHCHRTLDPAAIHFKRWDFSSAGYVELPIIPGVGEWRVTKAMLTGAYPYDRNPYARWRLSFQPNTVLTPITAAELEANPEAMFLDTMPSTSTLLGQKGDGTMGPLGFGKILLASGEFDRCTTQHLYERFVGRALDPAKEPGYLRALTARFVEGGRKLKPFVRHLLSLPELRRGL